MALVLLSSVLEKQDRCWDTGAGKMEVIRIPTQQARVIPELRLLSAIIQASGAFMLTGFVFVESSFLGLIPLPPGPDLPPALAGLVVKKPSGEMQKGMLKKAGGRPPCTPQGAALSPARLWPLRLR